MAKITYTLNVDPNQDSLDMEVDASEIYQEFIPKKVTTEMVQAVNPDGTPMLDGEGKPALIEKEVVLEEARRETLEEAVLRYVKENVTVDNVVKSGIERLEVEAIVRFEVSVNLVFEGEDELGDLAEMDESEIYDSVVADVFGDNIVEEAREAIASAYESDLEIDIERTNVS